MHENPDIDKGCSGGLGRVWLVALGYWAVVSALVCWLYPVTVFDPLARYAPMADAFARGDFAAAYHPRFGVLFTTLAGLVATVTGLTGDRCCQIVSVGFLAFSAVPVWSLVRRVFGNVRVAWASVVLLLVATEYFVYAQDGLRDTVRVFGLALCALAFLGASSGTIALGLFCLVTVRTDLFLISGAVLAGWWLFVLVRAVRSGALASIAGVTLPTVAWSAGVFLMCLMTHAYTGCWAPGAQFVKLFGRLFGGPA